MTSKPAKSEGDGVPDIETIKKCATTPLNNINLVLRKECLSAGNDQCCHLLKTIDNFHFFLFLFNLVAVFYSSLALSKRVYSFGTSPKMPNMKCSYQNFLCCPELCKN